jgi:hypothetical protein
MAAMRSLLVIATLLLAIGLATGLVVRSNSRAKAVAGASFTSPSAKPDFDSEIKPIFQARCQPCHFQGGKVYDKLPFDKAETINKLGTKLFTRIKDEKEQRLIREFLDAK